MRISLTWIFPSLCVLCNLVAIASPVGAQTLPESKQSLIGVKDVAWVTAHQAKSVAADLITQPMSISTLFAPMVVMPQVGQVADTIASGREQSPPRLTPFDVLKNPDENLQRFLNQAPLPPPPVNPREFFQLPALESSFKVNVSNFK